MLICWIWLAVSRHESANWRISSATTANPLHGQVVADQIGQVTGWGSTAIRARGTYTGHDREVLLCACSRSQSYRVKNVVHEIDPRAFVMLVETNQVFGEGFIEES